MSTELVEKIQPSTEKEYSFEEVYQLNHNGGRYELINGKLSEKMVASFDHGKYILRLGGKLIELVEENDLGAASTDAGFILRREPKLLRSPDISFVSKARIPVEGIPAEGYWEIAPDLAIEVVSPNDIMSEVFELANEYLEFGVKEVWLVVPSGKLVIIYRPDEKYSILSSKETLEGGEILPGFQLGLTKLFG